MCQQANHETICSSLVTLWTVRADAFLDRVLDHRGDLVRFRPGLPQRVTELLVDGELAEAHLLGVVLLHHLLELPDAFVGLRDWVLRPGQLACLREHLTLARVHGDGSD